VPIFTPKAISMRSAMSPERFRLAVEEARSDGQEKPRV
jgi:hypothetical protein